MYEPYGPSSSAHIDFETGDNVTWLDAVQFRGLTGPCGCTGPTGPNWTLTGTFQTDIRGDRNWGPTGPSLSLTSTGGTGSLIVIDDPVNLIMHHNVQPAVLLGASATGATGPGLVPGNYVYATRMVQSPNTIELMHGRFRLRHGV